VIMQPRTDGLPYDTQASVNPDLCTACGICAGACPTATPFRRMTELVAGIDMPELPIREIREHSLAATAKLSGVDRILVYGCQCGINLNGLAETGVGVVTLPCVAALPPSFIDFVVTRRHADGVMLVGCAAGDCYHRLGVEWMEQRLAGERDPYLRGRVPRERIATAWVAPSGGVILARELESFRARLKKMGPYQKGGDRPPPSAPPSPDQSEVKDVSYRLG
ncbi:MAG: hydrogenase iron-sulfur subunit, partial [Sulfuricaulis sp.]|nr:hydrogenase iron-sulfur subunit [Sulfuricaulis sp.]